MGKLSLYHYVLLASGLLAGLLMLVASIFMPVNDASVYSMRSVIEVTQTHLNRQDVAEASVYEVASLVAEDVADETTLQPVIEPVGEVEVEDISDESSSSSEIDDVTPSTDDVTPSNDDVMPSTEVETNPVEVSQVQQEYIVEEATATLASAEVDSASDESTDDSLSSADAIVIGDHRFREDREINNRKPRPTNTLVPKPTKTLVPTLKPAADIYWKADFETGNISQYSAVGGWIQQGTTPKYEVQTSIVRSGKYAAKFTINTSGGTSQAAYLFYWNTLPDAAYYSAWYYIPENVKTPSWWNIMQWKSTYNGNSDNSRPVFTLLGHGQALTLCYLPDRAADKACWGQGVKFPTNQWFHIETYYDRDKVDGHVIVWQDGVKLFDVSGYPTVLSDGTLHWSVNHYSDNILPNPASIYIDDVIISHSRMSNNTPAPAATKTLAPAATKTLAPVATKTPAPVATKTLAPVATKTLAPVATKTLAPVATKTNTPVATKTLAPVATQTLVPTLKPAADIFWKAGFETGDLSEYSGNGGWLRQGDTPSYSVQKSIVRSGQYAVKFTIDTSSKTAQSAYLFYWNTLPDAAYYSTWYYIPSNVDPQHWWNIQQWKSTYNGNSDYSRPVFTLGAGSKETLGLCYLPDKEADKVCWAQSLTLPKDRWFHIETYYDRDKVDGRVIVWQDGVKLFDVSGYPTVLSDGTLHWSVNHYTDDMQPNPSSIYLDDIIISHSRVGN